MTRDEQLLHDAKRAEMDGDLALAAKLRAKVTEVPEKNVETTGLRQAAPVVSKEFGDRFNDSSVQSPEDTSENPTEEQDSPTSNETQTPTSSDDSMTGDEPLSNMDEDFGHGEEPIVGTPHDE